jgi:hypothetical protein
MGMTTETLTETERHITLQAVILFYHVTNKFNIFFLFDQYKTKTLLVIVYDPSQSHYLSYILTTDTTHVFSYGRYSRHF